MYRLCHYCIEFEYLSSRPAPPKTALIYAAPQELPGERGKISLCLLQGKIRSEGEVKKDLVMFSSEDSKTIPSHGSMGREVNWLLTFSGPFSSFLLSALQGNAMKTVFPPCDSWAPSVYSLSSWDKRLYKHHPFPGKTDIEKGEGVLEAGERRLK